MLTKPYFLGVAAGLGAGMVTASALVVFGMHPYAIEVLGALLVGGAAFARVAAADAPKHPDA